MVVVAVCQSDSTSVLHYFIFSECVFGFLVPKVRMLLCHLGRISLRVAVTTF